MADPFDPIDPAPVASTTTKSNSTGLPSNVAAALACFPLIGGIIFYLLEKHDSFVRFYAMQSIIFGAVWFLFSYIVFPILHGLFASIPAVGAVLGGLIALLGFFVQIAFLVILIIAIIKAFTGVRWDIPYVGPLARKQMGESETTTVL